MKRILLTRGMVAKVDDDDFERLSQTSWCATKPAKRFWYAVGRWRCKDGVKVMYMHRIVMNAKKGQLIDHINQDSLDNRKSNLRIVTWAQNNSNSRPKRKGLPKGVHKLVKGGSWCARITHNGRGIYLGVFKTKEEAARAYLSAAEKYHGKEYVRTKDGGK